MQPLVFGKYQLLELIAVGGMAEVFRAKSFGVEGFEKTVVIKRILPHLARDQKFIEMFVNEAKIAARLSHANIVQIFDLGVERSPDGADSYFIAMEYVSGPDVAGLIRRAAKQGIELPIETCVFVAAQVARALDHAHRARDAAGRPLAIVHRDVSPHNILVSREGEVKLTDFGIVKASGMLADSEAGLLKGKYAYMAPEQARGDAIDHRVDLFALGVVLWEACAGRRLFKASTSSETLVAVTRAVVPRLAQVRPGAPEGLDEILARALRADPDERYQNAGDFHRDLNALLYQIGRRVGETDLAALLARMYGPSHRPDPNKLDRTAIDRAFEGMDVLPAAVGLGDDEPSGSGLGAPAGPRGASGSDADDDWFGASGPEASGATPYGTQIASPGGLGSTGRDARGACAVALAARVVGGPSPGPDELERARREILRFHGWFAEGAAPAEVLALFGWPQAGPFEVERALRAATRIAGDALAGAGAGAGWSVGVCIGPLGANPGGEVNAASLRDLGHRAAALAELAAEVGRGHGGVVVAQDEVASLGERWFRTEALPDELEGEGAPAVDAGGEDGDAGGAAAAGGDGAAEGGGALGLGDTAPSVPRAMRVMGLRSGAEGTQVHERTPFVGRGTYLRSLGRRLVRAAGGTGQVVALVGPAGIGKSRILAEMRASLRDAGASAGADAAAADGIDPDGSTGPDESAAAAARAAGGDAPPGWFEARCVPAIAEQPYRPLRDLVAGIAGVATGATPLETFQALDRLRPLGLRDRDVAALAGLFGDVVQVLAAPTPPGRPAVLELLGALSRLTAGLGRERAVILVIEDFQWVDSSTRDLLELWLDALAQRRVLVILTCRTELEGEQNLRVRFKRLEVAPMDEGETLALARGFLGVRRMPAALARHLVSQGQGNPFFVEELLEALLERRAIELRGGEALLHESIEGAGVPSSLRGLFAARLRGVSTEARRIATYAAAIGPRFHLDLLCAATRTSVRRAASILDDLARRGIVERVGAGTALQYGFTHELAREVLYEDLPPDRRVRVHGEIAARVEAASLRGATREAPLEMAEFLAAHYSRGPEPLRAARFLAAAGSHYARLRDPGRALDRYLRALALVGSEQSLAPADRAKRLLSLCEALATSGASDTDLPRVLDALERFRAEWPAAGDPAGQARVLERLAAMRAESGDVGLAEQILDEALVSAATTISAETALVARLHTARGMVRLSRGDAEMALHDLEQARELAEQGSAQAGIAAARVGLSRAYALAGDEARAVEQIAAAEPLARQMGGAVHADFLMEQAHLLFWRGDYAGALRSDLAALELARSEGFGPKLALASHRAGVDALYLDDYGRAFSYFGLSQDVAEEHGLAVLGAMNRAFLAFLEIAAGRGEDGVGEIERALELVAARHQRDQEARLRQLLARAQAVRGHQDEARQEIRRALRLAKQIGHRPLESEIERQVEQLRAG